MAPVGDRRGSCRASLLEEKRRRAPRNHLLPPLLASGRSNIYREDFESNHGDVVVRGKTTTSDGEVTPPNKRTTTLHLGSSGCLCPERDVSTDRYPELSSGKAQPS